MQGFNARMLAGWIKSMRTMYGKEEKMAKGKSGAAMGRRYLPVPVTSTECWQRVKGHGAGKFQYFLYFF